MSTKTNKLKTKDLIVAGAFAALYVVVLFAVVTVMGFVPILYLIAPFVNSVILGCIYMMYVTKVPKTGAILILSVAVGLLTSTGGVWVSLIWCLTLGIVAELIARAGNHKSKNPTYSAMLFLPAPAWHLSWMLAYAKPAFLQSCEAYYGADYAATLDKFTPSWIILVLIGIAMLGGLIGGSDRFQAFEKAFPKSGGSLMQLTEVAQRSILRIDARTKFALLFGVGISSPMFPPFWLEATTFALMALLLALNRRIQTSAKFTAVFLIMLLLDWTLSLKVSGGFAALFFTLVRFGRLMLPIFMAGILLMKTTSVSEFMLSFERMHLPSKLIIPLSVMFRFIPTISEEWHSIRMPCVSGGLAFLCVLC
ncbi:MAG: MptD family putative ECF transporter S component [Gallintestinimicrobium sp.]